MSWELRGMTLFRTGTDRLRAAFWSRWLCFCVVVDFFFPPMFFLSAQLLLPNSLETGLSPIQEEHPAWQADLNTSD